MTMDERIPDTQPAGVQHQNRFAEISLYCGFAAFGLPFMGPLAVLTPLACMAGAIAGVIGLLRAHRVAPRHDGAAQAWIGMTLCTFSFIAIGMVYASLLNYAQIPVDSEKPQGLAAQVNRYTYDNHGYYPASVSQLRLPSEQLSAKRFYFYYLHSVQPYLFNAHLAGKKIDDIADPARTILVAAGKKNGPTFFYSQTDLDFHVGRFIFVDGHNEAIGNSDRDISQHFPSGGRVTDDTWFIVPRSK
jgi:hypothetical protein